MICEICSEVLDDRKAITFQCKGHKLGKVVICKKCVSVGYMTKGSPVVYYDKGQGQAVTLETPEFAYPTGGSKLKEQFAHIAEECGWKVVRFSRPKPGLEYVPELFDQAMIHRYFNLMVPGEWYKDTAYSTEECFRKSCVNIRENYLGWVLRVKK